MREGQTTTVVLDVAFDKLLFFFLSRRRLRVELPGEGELRAAGVECFDKRDEGGGSTADTAANISALIAQLDGTERGNPSSSGGSTQSSTPLGTGLPALPKKLIARILANEYVDLAELPPAKGKARPMTQALEGQIVVVQAAELMQTKKMIPDLATWVQCFSTYCTVLLSKFPTRLAELMAYQTAIAKTVPVAKLDCL